MSEIKNPRGAGRKPIGSGKTKGKTYRFLATKEEENLIEKISQEAIAMGKVSNRSDYFIKCALKGL